MASLLDDLLALKDVLWASLNAADADKRASLAREYRSTLEKIDSLSETKSAGDPIDELASRRSGRSAGTAKSPRRSRRAGS